MFADIIEAVKYPSPSKTGGRSGRGASEAGLLHSRPELRNALRSLCLQP